jgi:hypothetical protein
MMKAFFTNPMILFSYDQFKWSRLEKFDCTHSTKSHIYEQVVKLSALVVI